MDFLEILIKLITWSMGEPKKTKPQIVNGNDQKVSMHGPLLPVLPPLWRVCLSCKSSSVFWHVLRADWATPDLVWVKLSARTLEVSAANAWYLQWLKIIMASFSWLLFRQGSLSSRVWFVGSLARWDICEEGDYSFVA